MDAELENVLNGLISGHDIVGVLVIDQTGQAIGAKGDVSNISAAEILQLEGSVQGSEGVSGFKLDHRRILLRREGDVLIAVFKNAYTRRMSNFTS